MDSLANFATSLVATAPSPALSGTTLVVAAGTGALFPTAPFYATCWPSGAQPTAGTAEIVRVTAVSTDTFAITRAQDNTTAMPIAVGWQIEQGVTAGLLEQAAAGSFPTFKGSGSPEGAQTATAVGQSYCDETNGALYFYNGTPPSNTGWASANLLPGASASSHNTPGVVWDPTDGNLFILVPAGTGNDLFLSDAASVSPAGLFNGWFYSSGLGGDGTQFINIQLGSTGQFFTRFDADGATALPGSLTLPLVTKSAPYTILSGEDSVIVTNSSVTLVNPVGKVGIRFTIKDNGAGTASVLPHGSETIDGASSKSLTAYESVTVVTDGTNWFII